MAELSVSVVELCSAAADLRGVVERMRSGLAGVDDELSELLGSGWVGAAGSSFGGVWQEWHEGASQVVSGLTMMAGLLETAARQYAGTDASEASAVGSAGL